MKSVNDIKQGDYIKTHLYEDAIFIEFDDTYYGKAAIFRYQAVRPNEDAPIWVLSSSDVDDISFSKERDPISMYVANLKGYYGEGDEYPPLPPKNIPIVLNKVDRAAFDKIMSVETDCYFYTSSMTPIFSEYDCREEILNIIREEWRLWSENYYNMKYAEFGWTPQEVESERYNRMNWL